MAEVTSSFKPYVVSISGLANSDETSWKGVPVLRWWHEGSVTLKGRIKVAVQYATKAGEQISWDEHIIESGQTRTFSNPSGQDMSIYLLETAPAPPPPPVYTCPHCGATFDSQAELNDHIESAHPEQPPPPPDGNGKPSLSGMHFMYGVDSGQDFSRVAEAKINLIFDYHAFPPIAWYDKALANGLWAFCNLKEIIHMQLIGYSDAEQWNRWNSFIKIQVTTAVNTVKNHPALYGYYPYDEDNQGNRKVAYDLQQEIYNHIKSLDPDGYVGHNIVYSGGDGYSPVNFDAMDFLMPDGYCFGDGGLGELNFGCNNLRNHLNSIGFTKPIVFIIQAMDMPAGNENWHDQLDDQMAVVESYNLATGGFGMYNWNEPGGGGVSNRTFVEIRDAWGASTWEDPGPVTYTCPYCGAVFTSQADLDAHIESEHPVVKLFCPYCGALFTTQAELDAHIASEHTFICPHCGATFSTQAELDAHIASEHPGETFTTKQITCTLCSSVLKVTISSIAENNRTLTCPLCQTTLPEAGTKVEIVSTPVIDQLRADIRALDEQIGQAETKIAELKGKVAEARTKVDAIKKLLGM